MASLKEIAREYRDEIMDGIAWVAIWKTGRSWNAKAFWLNLETERIEDEEMEEAREIVAAGTYHLETYEPGEEEQMPQSMNIWKEVERRKKAEKDLRRMIERWDVAMDHISESTQREIRKELGEETAEDRQQDSLDSFMKRMMDEENHTTEDYGWLEPDGTFHGVEWGAHQEWAQNYMSEKFPEEAMNGDIDLQIKCNVGLIGAGDWLVERGWVLLHNPSRGIAFPTKNPVKEYTKAQKEFLYDYYMERDCKKEANAIWQEDE